MERKMYNELIARAKELIAIPSVTENRKELDKVLEKILEPIKDFPMEFFEENNVRSVLVRNMKKQTRDFTIVLNAHLDVVPAKYEQYQAYEKDGKLYGRGAYDMKTVALVMVYLFQELAKDLPFPIALQLVTDEEVGGFHGVKYQIAQGLRCDFAITGDTGSNLQLVNKAKGLYWFKLHAKGLRAHGGYPWRGENALWKLYEAVNLLHKTFPTPSEEAWVTTMNLAKIETTNNVYNNVPDQATAYIDMRVIPEDAATIAERVKSILPTDIAMEVYMHDAAEDTPRDNPYMQKLAQAIEIVTKEKPQFITANAPSDMRHFNAVKCAGVEFGLVGKNQHGDEEFLEMSSIEKYYDILRSFLLLL